MRIKKLKKFLLTLCSLVLCLSCCFGLCGCDVAEMKNATMTAVETASSIIPVAIDETLAKNIYTSALANSKLQNTSKLTVVEFLFLDGCVINAYGESHIYWDNLNGSTKIFGDFGGSGGFIVKYDDTYYELDAINKTYQEGTGRIGGSQVVFTLLNKVKGGMIYEDGNAFLTVETGVEGNYAQIVIKNNLIVGYSNTVCDNQSIVTCISNWTYEYNVDTTDIFKGLPSSLSALSALGYTSI